MRGFLAFLLSLFLLCGCTRTNDGMEQAISLRDAIINGNGCTFAVTITADYQDKYYTFVMNCQSDSSGNVTFEVTEPESISGITGSISANNGKLTFDDHALVFSTLAEGQITPISAPWLFINTLRSGYIKGCAQEDSGLLLEIDDSYAENAIQLIIQIIADIPVFAEIIWQNRRIVTMKVEDFCIL